MKLNRYADDYETVVEVDEKGKERKKARYKGEYFTVMLDADSIKNYRNNSLLIGIGAVLAHIGAGCFTNAGMYQFYIAVPYVAAFFPLLYLMFSVFRLPAEKKQMTRDEVGLSFDRIRPSSLGAMILSAMCALGELIFLIVVKSEVPFQELACSGLEALTAAMCYLMLYTRSRIRIESTAKFEKSKG